MSRQEVVQQAPSSAIDFTAGFPTEWLSDDGVLVRAHSTEQGAGYYSSSLEGRFDLSGKRGTCYAADDATSAIRERLGFLARHGRITFSDATDTRVTSFRPVGGWFAAASTPAAALFGVTAELTSMADYAIPQAWAAAFDAAGLAGIRYSPRFTPGPASAWAIFGTAGPGPIGTVLAVAEGPEACEAAGFIVLPKPPSSADITKLDPPTG